MASMTDLDELDAAVARIENGDCAYCGMPSEGNYSIHRDGFGFGPEVPLCDLHGSLAFPTCEQIWAVVARAES